VGYSNRYLFLNTNNGQNAWAWDGTTTMQIGLASAAHTGIEGFQFTVPKLLNNAGLVAGYSRRITDFATDNGRDAWVWNGTVNTQIGLSDGVYTGGEGLQSSEPRLLNDAGQIAGDSARFRDQSTSNGKDAWVWNGTTTTPIGLIGGANTGSQGYQYSEAKLQNAAGQVAGHSRRYSNVNTENGRDAWVWNGTTTTQLGLVGGAYTTSTGRQFSEPDRQNAAGQIAGISQRFNGSGDSNGYDVWVWNDSTTRQIGLTGGPYTGTEGYQNSELWEQNAAGTVTGTSRRYLGINTDIGFDAWVWNGTATTRIGFIGSAYTSNAGYQVSEPWRLNASGQVAGISRRVNPDGSLNGQDAWVRLNATTAQIGLTGSVYTGSNEYRWSEPLLQNDAGQIAGTSTRFTNGLSVNGQDTWVSDGATTTRIGLVGEVYTGSAGYQYSTPQFQNAAGQVVGYSRRITGVDTDIGQDAWYYNPATGVTSAIIGDVRTSDHSAFSQPMVLTEDGLLLGFYLSFSESASIPQRRAFIYRPDVGLSDLDALVIGGLPAHGWSTLYLPLFGDASIGNIVGEGYVAGQTTGRSVFVLNTACPADLDNDGSLESGGTRDRAVTIDDLLFLLAAFESGNMAADLDNGSGSGTRDNAVTIDDLLYFLTHFEAGC